MLRTIALLLCCLFSTRASAYFDDPTLIHRAHTLAGRTVPLNIQRLIFFGDSFSDADGRMLARSKGLVPDPMYHWGGRFSNGPVWTDYLKNALRIPALNYAMGGSRLKAYNLNASIPGSDLFAFLVPPGAMQVETFALEHRSFRPNDLAFVWLGGNDYLSFADESMVAAYAQQTVDILRRVLQLGAENLAYMPIPSFRGLPFHPVGLDGRPFDRDRLEELIVEHNHLVAVGVGLLRADYPGRQIMSLDIESILSEIRSEPERFGIESLYQSCFKGEILAGMNHPWLLYLMGKGPVACAKAEQSFFWDGVHPTTKVHCLVAGHVMSQLQLAGFLGDYDRPAAEEACVGRGGDF